MKTISTYIPRDKSDLKRVEELSKIGYPFYKPILGDLFRWIQDINWPVAQKIVSLLIAAGDDVIPHVKTILNSNDAIWKYWTLTYIVSKMPPQIIKMIKKDLERIVNNPSDSEILEEVNMAATNLLRKIRETSD